MLHKSKVRTLPEAHGTNQITDNVGPKFWNGIKFLHEARLALRIQGDASGEKEKYQINIARVLT